MNDQQPTPAEIAVGDLITPYLDQTGDLGEVVMYREEPRPPLVDGQRIDIILQDGTRVPSVVAVQDDGSIILRSPGRTA
jgi:hypothetical protein